MGFQETFRALSDPTRRAILEKLRSGRLTAGQIAQGFDMTGATISHHLSLLKEADLVRDEKQGKFIYYELNTSVVEDVMVWVSSLLGEEHHEKP